MPDKGTRTPLFDALREYAEKNISRFHMPGHKGALPFPFEAAALFDVTEVKGADSLYEATGAIAALEREYAGIYGSYASFLSAGGSTLCIQAMLSLCMSPGGSLICGRGAHVSAVNAMALLDLKPVWVYPEPWGGCGLSGGINPAEIDAALRRNPGAGAVYLTSPNYYGALCDIEKIADICHSRGVPLLVDNAHGAHLKFLPESIHPMDSGADMCADSLHKTLPVLTGGALLHIKNPDYARDAKTRMSLFGSTSPSYLVMLSCDMALEYIKNAAGRDILRIMSKNASLREMAAARGFSVPPNPAEPARLTLGFREIGYTEAEFGHYMRSKDLEPEYLGEGFCVFLSGPGNTDGDFSRLEKAIREIPVKPSLPVMEYAFPAPMAALSIREAVFARCEKIPVSRAEGRVASGMVSSCPPGVPMLMPGEKLDFTTISYLKNYGILDINVIK